MGYAPGVGKTQAMLQAAQRRREEGLDVVVAVSGLDSRTEPDLTVLSSCRIQSSVYGEIDIEVILDRRPQLVCIDNLAHTNAPGVRHTRRYQDVEDLLSTGIDVYATLNVPHLASLCDIVAHLSSTYY